MHQRFHQKGFTLVEMILYVAICSLFLLTLSTFLSYLLQARVRSQAIAEVNQQGTQVMYMMTETIRNGRTINTPSIGATSTTLSVTTGVPLLDPTVFSVGTGTVYITEGSRAAVALTNSRVIVSNFVLSNISSASSTDRIVRISFTLDYKTQSSKTEYSLTKGFTGSATLRQ